MRADTVIILCAGGSRRMGHPKGLLPLDGAPLLAHQVAAFADHARRRIVVLGARAEEHARVLPHGVEVVLNPDWERSHPADSLRRAILGAHLHGTAWVTPVDVPPPRPETLEALLRAGAPAVPRDAEGRDGHPVLLDEGLVRRIGECAPEGGLRALLGDARRVPVSDPLVARDFDDPEAWRAFLVARRAGEGVGRVGPD